MIFFFFFKCFKREFLYVNIILMINCEKVIVFICLFDIFPPLNPSKPNCTFNILLIKKTKRMKKSLDIQYINHQSNEPLD